MCDGPFKHVHRVTYGDCTAGNHVYYGRFLNLLEAARGEFVRSLGTSFLFWQEKDVVFPVIECHLRYQAMAHYDDVLQIAAWIRELEGVRVVFGYRITKSEGTLVLQGETMHVCTNTAGKPKRLPEELLGFFKRGLLAEISDLK